MISMLRPVGKPKTKLIVDMKCGNCGAYLYRRTLDFAMVEFPLGVDLRTSNGKRWAKKDKPWQPGSPIYCKCWICKAMNAEDPKGRKDNG